MMLPSIFGENLFNDWMDFSFPDFPDVDKKLYGKRAGRVMKTDVKELENSYEVAVDLPGFKKEEVQIELKDGCLTIQAAKALENDSEKKDGTYIRRERYSGSMSRSFYVGKEITKDDVHAKFENGILTLDIPKKEAQKEVETNHYVTIEG